MFRTFFLSLSLSDPYVGPPYMSGLKYDNVSCLQNNAFTSWNATSSKDVHSNSTLLAGHEMEPFAVIASG